MGGEPKWFLLAATLFVLLYTVKFLMAKKLSLLSLPTQSYLLLTKHDNKAIE